MLPAHAQTSTSSGESGIAALPQTTPPPPVTTDPVPSSPVLPQTSIGGQPGQYPLAPSPRPIATPGPVPDQPLGVPARPGAQPTRPSGVPAQTAPGGPAPTGAEQEAQRIRMLNGIATGRSGPDTAPSPNALDLVKAFDLGYENDPTFRAAVAERQVNRLTADQSIAGYLPSASYSFANIPTENGTRHVVSVTQPLVSVSGYATLKQRGPRRRYADATFEVREQDLAVRTVTAITDIIKANEASALNESKIEALRTQSDRAERLYRNGLGTITDARDIQVRYEQSLANRVLLRSDQIAAAARLESITGGAVETDDFRLPSHFGPIALQPADSYLMRQETANPQIAAARENERIGRLEALRTRGSMFPVVGASATYSSRAGVESSYVGLSVNAPLNAGTFFQSGAANATARRSAEERRATEARARVELQRLYALVDGGQQALALSSKAIESAELSVYANTQSYEGGVRTNVDVVNAIQTVFEVKNTQVTAATTLALNYLNLLLLAGVPSEDAVEATQRFLLNR
ncbi:TolC family protein [Sphingomonas hengshuiensis]|uniref:TolC family protein n=1 Tax=Sphingomonas hengshuiensis TaxID=1609977 RepID=UPI00138DDF27|nr:TolC family protein [Sphingomonas hengshuiensis]